MKDEQRSYRVHLKKVLPSVREAELRYRRGGHFDLTTLVSAAGDALERFPDGSREATFYLAYVEWVACREGWWPK